MATQKLIRWSAIAWLFSALTGIIYTLLIPSDYAENAVLSSLWTPMHALATASYILFPFGLVGVYLVQADKAGRIGSIGYVLAFFGTSMLVAQVVVATWILPVIALQPNAPKTAFEMLDPAGPLAAFSSVILFAYLPAGIGLILIGIATMRAGVLPRWAGLLLIISTVLEFAVLFGQPGELIVKVGDVALDVAKVWFVYALWSQKGAMAMQPKAAM